MGHEGVERASITIDAPIEVVWSVFTDVERWPTWASSFTSVELIDGPMRLGAKARIRQPRATGLHRKTKEIGRISPALPEHFRASPSPGNNRNPLSPIAA